MTNGVIEKTVVEDLEIARKCVNDFLETAEIEIEGLKDYDFRNLYDKKFHKFRFKDSKDYERDEDSFYLTRCINFILYHESLDNMRTFEEMEKNYGGETINTYNTLMGKHGQGFEKYFKNPTKKELKTIKNFEKKYLTIGNFMLLPLKPIDNNHSLNQIKGTYTKYRDFFDLFAFDLFNESKDNYIYGKIDLDIDKFYESNLLQKYPKKRNIFGHYDEYPYYWWKDVEEKKYRDFTINYMEKATKLIEKRAMTICKKLDKELFKKA